MQNIKIQLSNLFGCSSVRMLSIYSNQRESCLLAMPKLTIPVSISLSRLLFLMSWGLLSILCLFSQPVQHNNRSFNPLTISQPVACRHVHTYTALHSVSCCPSLSFRLCHTHINSAPPPPTPSTNLSRSLHWPPITRSHSLEMIVKLLKHSGSIKSHIIHVGGWRLQKSYWQKAMNETERMAEFQTQENCNVPKL